MENTKPKGKKLESIILAGSCIGVISMFVFGLSYKRPKIEKTADYIEIRKHTFFRQKELTFKRYFRTGMPEEDSCYSGLGDYLDVNYDFRLCDVNHDGKVDMIKTPEYGSQKRSELTEENQKLADLTFARYIKDYGIDKLLKEAEKKEAKTLKDILR